MKRNEHIEPSRSASGEIESVSYSIRVYSISVGFGRAYITRDDRHYPTHWVLTCEAIGLLKVPFCSRNIAPKQAQQMAMGDIRRRVEYINICFERWKNTEP